MPPDDDDVIIRHKLVAVLTKPVTALKRWHVLALLVAAFVAGAWVF